MFRTFSAEETAQIIGVNRHSLPLMRELQMLLGIKVGKGWRYSEKEIEEFWDTYRGYDISNAESIRMTAALNRNKKGR